MAARKGQAVEGGMMPTGLKILLVGSGRVAFHMGHALRAAGHVLTGVAGRNAEHTAALADKLGCASFPLTTSLPTASVILIAVSDDAIADVAMHLPISGAVVIHTSGASELDRLAPHPHRGVIWPVMTLSPGIPMDLAHVPLVIDANTEAARSATHALADSLSGHVTELVHAERELVHTAAAISTNFPLFLLDAAQRLLKDQGIDPALLMPSFVAMAAKAEAIGPHDALTGPARRGDQGTVQRHLDRLAHDPELRRAYALLSNMILRANGHPDHEHHDL